MVAIDEQFKMYGRAGIALRGARFREGLTQKDLAKRSGVSQENISKMESGRRAIGEEVAKGLAKLLKIDPALLCGGSFACFLALM